MSKRLGKINLIQGNIIAVSCQGDIVQNEVGYVSCGKERLMAEVIRINYGIAYMQVFEDTKGVRVGDQVDFSGQMLSVKLGPGLLGQIFDGLQNPLPELAEKFGFFLPRGEQIEALNSKRKWDFQPSATSKKDRMVKGSNLGFVQEGVFKHQIMVPFYLSGDYQVETIAPAGSYKITDTIAKLKNSRGEIVDITMAFNWPIKIPIQAYKEKFTPQEPLITKARIIDTLFPVAKGGTYCIPGPFGSGKTVLQQLTSRYAEVDIVIIAACGERAGEVVETLRKFPELVDPRTSRPLMERTIIICNTSSMPVAARDASVYTAATLGEYYRQMGLDVLLLADSTSRWAQAMREVSGRLEEIPGEEAYPAYLESRIAEFYERSGLVGLNNGQKGSLTIGGTISPAGGNFEEPVTQATLKVVGAFHGLSRDRANARRFPSIDPLDSWSRYTGFIDPGQRGKVKAILAAGDEVYQMMKVVGEEGTSMEDFIVYLKSEFIDSVYLQQNGFDKVDAATDLERQKYVFGKLCSILDEEFKFSQKEKARYLFYELRQIFIDWNYKQKDSDEFKQQERKIDEFIKQKMLKDEKST
ncbi:MAG: V-type ATP synthase subunit A [Candidatus Omnitrophica bacterium]|nr:V-type ATP synthase subunit A [Candidatus Omnitrophota bacterium]MBU2044224.1 V-type ATP synthase subunit A [Candidatus Omnitrophota bacterium]MBU2265453.1 V-type ATP synthase subunit A [Candidatus Omnitrophota bacterium]MBU2473459.1 V-type ATP synthase subunit A [Candidatus Omnitrophota bacterium]